MAVICLTRELAAKGEETARELARLGGYRYIERDYIEARLAEHKIGADILQQYDEKRPGLWASMSENRDRYLHFLKAIIYEETAKGRCVILGRGAWALLREVPGVLSVRLMAPPDVRLGRPSLQHPSRPPLALTRQQPVRLARMPDNASAALLSQSVD